MLFFVNAVHCLSLARDSCCSFDLSVSAFMVHIATSEGDAVAFTDVMLCGRVCLVHILWTRSLCLHLLHRSQQTSTAQAHPILRVAVRADNSHVHLHAPTWHAHAVACCDRTYCQIACNCYRAYSQDTNHLLQLALGQGRCVTSLYLFSRKVLALVIFFPIALAFQAK